MFEKASSIIKDSSILDYDYVPKNLVNREEQMHDLEVLFRPLAQSGRSCTAFLTGSVGTGKTATAKRFCQDMTEYCAAQGKPIRVLYVNCRNTNSESAVLLHLIRYFDAGYPDRGFSVEEMARVLRVHLVSNRQNMVVILDEVDILLKKSTVDIVYQLTRFSDDLNQAASVSLIMISQISIFDYLDAASASTFRRSTTVKFNKYSREELRQIVAIRAEEALFPGRISEEALDQIADSSEEYGDARMAIELLDRAANMAEDDVSGEVTVENIRAAKAMIFSSVSESKLDSLDINRKIVLLAVSRAMKQNVTIMTATAEKTYAVVCEEYEVPARKHTQFWVYIQDLEKMGLLKTRVSADGKGRTTMISLPDIPSKVLAKKLEEILDKENRESEYDEM